MSQFQKQNPGTSSCCNDSYKPVRQSGTPLLLQADRLSDYQDIYDWKSKPNFAFFLTVFITLQYIGENEYGKTGHSKIFILRHFLIILKCNFFRASILHHVTDTDIKHVGPCILDLTLFSDAFNYTVLGTNKFIFVYHAAACRESRRQDRSTTSCGFKSTGDH